MIHRRTNICIAPPHLRSSPRDRCAAPQLISRYPRAGRIIVLTGVRMMGGGLRSRAKTLLKSTKQAGIAIYGAARPIYRVRRAGPPEVLYSVRFPATASPICAFRVNGLCMYGLYMSCTDMHTPSGAHVDDPSAPVCLSSWRSAYHANQTVFYSTYIHKYPRHTLAGA